MDAKTRRALADVGARLAAKHLGELRRLLAEKPAAKATGAHVDLLLAVAKAEHAAGAGYGEYKRARRMAGKRRAAARKAPDVFSLEV